MQEDAIHVANAEKIQPAGRFVVMGGPLLPANGIGRARFR
jgi:hypothetical protein